MGPEALPSNICQIVQNGNMCISQVLTANISSLRPAKIVFFAGACLMRPVFEMTAAEAIRDRTDRERHPFQRTVPVLKA